MTRENTVWEYTKQAGYEPIEGRSIIVKPAGRNLSDKLIKFFEWSDLYVLQLCENEMVCLPFDRTWTTLSKEISLAIPYQDIESVDLSEDLLNTEFSLRTPNGEIRFTTQQPELSDYRLSGIYATQFAGGYKNWHKDNVKITLEALRGLCA